MRLNEGRQVLAPLVGILGTIVGFYFGQVPASTAPPAALQVTAVTPSAEQVAPGGVVTLTATVSGGKAPFDYTFTIPGVMPPITGKLTAAGPIKQEVTIPKDAKPTTSAVTVQLQVKDSVGATLEAKSEKPLVVR